MRLVKYWSHARFWSIITCSWLLIFLIFGTALLHAKDSLTIPCFSGYTLKIPLSHSLPSFWNPEWVNLLQISNLSTPKCVTPALSTRGRAKLKDMLICSRGRRQKFCRIHFVQYRKLFCDELHFEFDQLCYQPAVIRELENSRAGVWTSWLSLVLEHKRNLCLYCRELYELLKWQTWKLLKICITANCKIRKSMFWKLPLSLESNLTQQPGCIRIIQLNQEVPLCVRSCFAFASGQLHTHLPGVMTRLSSAAPALLLCTLAVLFRTSLSVGHVPMLLWSSQR